jgi:hypothetical protein
MLDTPISIRMEEMRKSRQIEHGLYAPKEAGLYEVRLYDRGHIWEWKK